MKRFDYRKRMWGLGLFVLSMAAVSGFLFANKDNYVNATLSGWNASNIISDYVMTDYNSMTEAQIQSFLKSKVNCNNTELWRRASTKVTWNIKDSHFVCMADDSFNGESAAHIIKQAAIDYKINPKVLIVTLQKESSLITDSMPHSGQYKTAMGFGCPDTAACDSKYFGLKNQIRNAARFFRAYQDNASGWYKPYWTGNYKVHWHPDLSRCGGVNLNIQNRATASLYSYTPYQPNRAALNAGWGTGDTCSSYGNRNFYNYFTSWFGDTRVNIAKIKTDLPEDKYRLRYLNDTATTVQPKTQNNTIKVDMIAGARKNNNYDCFQLKKVASQIYSLISCANNLAVDVAGGTATDGNNVWQYTQNGTDAQKWYIYDNEDGTYSFATIKDPNLVLTKDGSGNLVLTFYTRSDAQKFRSTQISPKIANGVYNIKSNLDSTKLIDVKSASPLSGANVQLWTKNSSSAQWFNFEFDAQTGYYKISNFFTKKNLDVYGAGNANGTNVQMYNANNTNAQKWQIVESGNGTFNLLSASSGKALDISNGKNQNGSNMQIWVRNKTNAQKWLLQKETRTLDDGLYYIESFTNTHFVLDADNLDRKAGSNIQLATRNDRIDQAFYIKYLPNIGLYKIVNKVSNKSLDVKSAKDTAGTNIQIWNDKEGHEAQLWDIIKNSDGSYSILTVCGGRAVDIKSGIIKSGVNIQTWTRNNTIAQKWLFERAN